MIDTANKLMYKVMWVPGHEGIIWDIHNEEQVPVDDTLYSTLKKYIDIEKWEETYKSEYHSWLEADNNSIHDINNEVNLLMIEAIGKANNSLVDKLIFYWFDIDRTDVDNFYWEYCPLSNKKLVALGNNYPKMNSFISIDYPIIFPAS
jgi:hypothetical protein